MLDTRVLALAGIAMALVVAMPVDACATPDTLLTAPPVDTVHDIAIGDTLASDFAAFGSDVLMLLSAPSRFDEVDWYVAGASVVGTVLLVPLDDDVRDITLPNRSRVGNDVSAVANVFGRIVPGAALSGAVYMSGLAFDEPSVRIAGRHALQALLYSGITTSLAKIVLGRSRPAVLDGQYRFEPLRFDDPHNSFPSGHATVAFALASSFSADIDHPVATIALYSMAAATAASRVYDDRHWMTDVVVGAVVGTVCGYGVANMGEAEPAGSSIIIAPSVDRLTLVWTF